MAETLYIIGNGFDLHHGAPSSFQSFGEYLRVHNHSLHSSIEQLYDSADMWGDFENNLITISRETFIDYIGPVLPINEVGDDNFSYGELYYSRDLAQDLIQNLIDELKFYFHHWIKTLTIPEGNQQRLIGMESQALYLSFNYTDFLEKIYQVQPDQICYLHGKKSDKMGSIILGHGEGPDYNLEKWIKKNHNKSRFRSKFNKQKQYYTNSNLTYLAYFLKDERKGNWASEAQFHALSDAVAQIEDYYEQSFKNFHKVLEAHDSFFSSLHKIKKIIVKGHSLSKVDEPYIRKIIEMNHSPDEIDWKISFHTDRDLDKINDFAKEFNIEPSRLGTYQLCDCPLKER